MKQYDEAVAEMWKLFAAFIYQKALYIAKIKIHYTRT